MSDIVILRSKDRSSGSATSGIITLSEINKLSGSYRVSSFLFPNTIYNVTVNNNKVYFDETSGLKTATLTPGFYTAIELAGEVQVVMNAVGVETYTVTYNENTHRYLVACSTGVFAFNFVDNTLDSAGLLLGYPDDQKYVASIASVSINTLDLNPYKMIYFNAYEGSQNLVDSADNYASFFINIDTGFSDVVRQDLSAAGVFMSFSNKKNFTYSITDSDGNSTVSLNGSEWLLVLEKLD